MSTILRAGCYSRVSTEEQVIHGFSIETQKANLEEYCKNNNIQFVEHYTDEGISGAKPPLKRPALQQLINDIKGDKIDIVLFTKLDRWFRSVKEYFKVQEILDDHKVQWKAIHEDYDTTTANGQFAITIFLAVAQQERDRTSERIKVVLDHKRKNKEACFGGKHTPFGYMKQKDENGVMRLVKDPETCEIVQEFWDMMFKYNNLNKAARTLNETYGINRTQKSWVDIIRNPIYCGMYKDIEDYCEPYISKKDWLKMQEMRPIKQTQKERVYLFTGLVKCPKCGRNLYGTFSARNNKDGERVEWFAYRCRGKNVGVCDFTHNVSEKRIEKYLLTNIDKLLADEIAKVELQKTAPKPKKRKSNLASLKEKLRRLNVSYMAEAISDEEYLSETKRLTKLIKNAEQEETVEEELNLDEVKEILETDFRTLYNTFDKEDKRRFWRSIIKEIHVDKTSPVGVKFFS